MTTPLIEALTARHGFTLVDTESLDGFLEAREHSVLFFPGDAERLVESNDVAVILPEILKVYGGKLTPALVAKPSERLLQRRFRFNAFPSIVFMRRTGYLGVLPRVLDWSEYLDEIAAILARDVSEPPPFEFPDGCYSNGMAREGENSARGEFQ